MIPIRLWAAIFCLLLVFPAITLAQLSPPTSQPSDEDAFVIGDRPPTQVPAGLGGAGANQDNNTGRGYGDDNLQLALPRRSYRQPARSGAEGEGRVPPAECPLHATGRRVDEIGRPRVAQ